MKLLPVAVGVVSPYEGENEGECVREPTHDEEYSQRSALDLIECRQAPLNGYQDDTRYATDPGTLLRCNSYASNALSQAANSSIGENKNVSQNRAAYIWYHQVDISVIIR